MQDRQEGMVLVHEIVVRSGDEANEIVNLTRAAKHKAFFRIEGANGLQFSHTIEALLIKWENWYRF